MSGLDFMAEIKLAVDVGGSLTKSVYSYKLDQGSSYGARQYLLFEPQVESISASRFNHYYQLKGSLGAPKLENNAWLIMGERYVVVGSLAKEFDPEDRLRDYKYELAIYKVLAAVGIIVRKHGLKPKSLQVKLGVLLPWNEYNDRSLFAQRLRQLGESYCFQKDLQLSLKFSQIEVRPEGFGLFQAFYRTVRTTKQENFITEGRQGILMLGHRNVTGLYFEQGRLVAGDSPLLGFSDLCDRVVELSSRSNREQVALAISQTISEPKNFYSFVPYKDGTFPKRWQLKKTYPIWEQMPLIKALSPTKEPELHKAEVQRIADAIRQATEEYWMKLAKWLGKIFAQSLDGVVVSGGTQLFLEPKLENYFNCVEVFQTYSCPDVKSINDYHGQFGLERVTSGNMTPIYNRRTLLYRYDELAKAFNLAKSSHLMERLLDVYELHWKL